MLHLRDNNSMPNIRNGTVFGDPDWPLNVSHGLSAIAVSLFLHVQLDTLDVAYNRFLMWQQIFHYMHGSNRHLIQQPY